MNSHNDIQSELIQLNSSLPFDVKTPVFDLPESYFENFASGVLAKIKGEPAVTTDEELATLSPLLAGLSKKMPFTLPENYFRDQVLNAVSENADDVLPEWMQQGRNMPFAVPEGYFEAFAGTVLQRTAARQETKVIGMFSRTWVRYAAAAVVVGALVLGGFLYPGNKSISPVTEPEAWVEKKLQNVSNQELEEFINTVETFGTETAVQTGNNKVEAAKLLKDVPDSELDAFLNQFPDPNENLN
jgi:hypothetical protein